MMYLRARPVEDLTPIVGAVVVRPARSPPVSGPTQRRARHQLPDAGVRLRALRVLLGEPTPTSMARRLDIEGLGPATLKDIEAPSRPRLLWDYEADAIAEAAGVPASFFTAPLERLGDVAGVDGQASGR